MIKSKFELNWNLDRNKRRINLTTKKLKNESEIKNINDFSWNKFLLVCVIKVKVKNVRLAWSENKRYSTTTWHCDTDKRLSRCWAVMVYRFVSRFLYHWFDIYCLKCRAQKCIVSCNVTKTCQSEISDSFFSFCLRNLNILRIYL